MVYNNVKPKRAQYFFCVLIFCLRGLITMENTVISESLTEYVGAIYEISRTNEKVRTTDIAQRLGISKPSVNRAVYALKSKGLVTHEPYGAVALTEKGVRVVETTGRKNRMIKNFLITVLRLTDDEAEREACLIGHSMSEGTVERMNSYMMAMG